MWTEQDRDWAKAHDLDLAELERQLALFNEKSSIPIDRPATLGDGIQPLDELVPGRALPVHRLTAFVPASGAATRMFKSLLLAHEESPEHNTDWPPELAPARVALENRAALPLPTTDTWESTLHLWLEVEKLHQLPKGLVPLHRYPNEVRTAVAEHLVQLKDLGGTALHLTVAADHQDAFHAALRHQSHCHATTSVQHPSTDTLALDLQGALFRLDDGTPLLRPGGHGALLKNLEDLNGDLVLVRNIDNVAREEHAELPTRSRARMVAMTERIEAEVHRYLRNLDQGEEPAVAIDYAKRMFGRIGRGQTAFQMAKDALTRPLRIVGVVRNTGAPGGGPFWTEEPDGSVTPQIVEAAQVSDDPEQQARFARASHFNPVDMVLAMRDVDGNPYALVDFIDSRGWIRASKSYGGRPLQALERPGLWNGSMSGWNTVFVELPEGCFHPVKTVADLLAHGHVEP